MLEGDFSKKPGSITHISIWVSNTIQSFRKTNEPIPRKLLERKLDRQADGRTDHNSWTDQGLFWLQPGVQNWTEIWGEGQTTKNYCFVEHVQNIFYSLINARLAISLQALHNLPTSFQSLHQFLQKHDPFLRALFSVSS